MRLIVQLGIAIVCASFSLSAISADKQKMGSIRGSINFCGKGGLDGMQVYIPGQPYLVITGNDGRFQLLNVPTGTYDLHYRFGERLLNRNQGVRVFADMPTDLSVISFCDHAVADAAAAPGQLDVAPVPAKQACVAGSTIPDCLDADGDGVVAAQDCDDNNAKIFPGAIERCDGIDNNCNGQVDEQASVLVLHGMGTCQDGKVVIQQCASGFSDCDGQVSNGCEVDTNNDTEHCGSCRNSCTPTEICVVGECE